MPYTNLFKNCGYYWGFAAFVSYFVNHPLYTPPNARVSAALFGLAMLCQLANLRCAGPQLSASGCIHASCYHHLCEQSKALPACSTWKDGRMY